MFGFGGLYEEVLLINFEDMTNFETCHNTISLHAGGNSRGYWGV